MPTHRASPDPRRHPGARPGWAPHTRSPPRGHAHFPHPPQTIARKRTAQSEGTQPQGGRHGRTTLHHMPNHPHPQASVMSWTTSDRRKRLPNNWPHLITQTRNRAKGQCQATRHHPKCDGQGSECDHITPGDNHTLSNLQWLNHHCHKMKTQAEVAANNTRRATMRKRPEEKHPGQTK